MLDPTKPSDRNRSWTIAVVSTFTALMHTYERRELALAAHAQAELARHGIVVRFTRPKALKTEGQNHAR